MDGYLVKGVYPLNQLHMKKLVFAALSVALCCFIWTSCGMSGGCSIVGTWKVSDVKITSEKFSPSIVNSMDAEYRRSSYEFNADGTMIISTTQNVSNPGTYVFDQNANTLTWKDNERGVENGLKVLSCTAEGIELYQRMPGDESKPAVAEVTFTLVPQ